MTIDDSIEETAANSVGGTDPVSLPSAGKMIGAIGMLASQGTAVTREAAGLVSEGLKITVGRSKLAPDRKDRRFADPTWSQNPAYKRVMQTYLASCRAVDNLVDNLDQNDWEHTMTARFLADIVTSAASPTNFVTTNPAAIKRAFETGGGSLVKGLGHWADDLRNNRGLPSMVKEGQFVVGKDLAVTPGTVVSRDEHAELIHYTPTTEKVYERPTLIVPPPIGRFYFLDMSHKRSFVEYSTESGIQTYMLSWRNPTPQQRAWTVDDYADRIIRAIDEVREATGQDQVNLISFCAGGILSTIALNALSARGVDPVANLAMAVTLLDFGGQYPINTFGYSPLLSIAKWNSRRKGIIDAKSMGAAFTWLRPNELVWNYWVNNYLMGDEPPAFDILSWNADGTALPAALHGQFLELFRTNGLTSRGEFKFLDAPYDLSTITVPSFHVGAVNDHLTPWRGNYRNTELLGSTDVTFALSNAGHIASLVNPPGNPKASYFVGEGAGELDADTWRERSEKRTGSWWELWVKWSAKRSGKKVDAPAADDPSLGPAPGLDVVDEVA